MRRHGAAGADIIDVGRIDPSGASPVSTQEESTGRSGGRAIAAETGVTISIDTSKPEVAAAVAAGAELINDVQALRAEGALETAARLGVDVCLMHMQGRPRDMQHDPRFADVVAEVEAFLRERAGACEASGIPAARILIDPGFGFGKTLDHNLALFRARRCADRITACWSGSRASHARTLTGKPVEGVRGLGGRRRAGAAHGCRCWGPRRRRNGRRPEGGAGAGASLRKPGRFRLIAAEGPCRSE
jgi:dihydropteroate synthase